MAASRSARGGPRDEEVGWDGYDRDIDVLDIALDHGGDVGPDPRDCTVIVDNVADNKFRDGALTHGNEAVEEDVFDRGVTQGAERSGVAAAEVVERMVLDASAADPH